MVPKFSPPVPFSNPPYSLIKQRFSDITPDTSRPKSADIDKHRSESFPRPNSSTQAATAPSPEHSGPGFPYTGAIAKKSDLTSSMSSQDSGINMCFTEQDDKIRSVLCKDRYIASTYKTDPKF